MVLQQHAHRVCILWNTTYLLVYREAFQVPDVEHGRIVDEVAKKILDLARNFAAQVKVKGW